MPTILTLPKIGVNMTEAIIVNWLVNEGDFIEEGQMIMEAETDKATQEIPSTRSGILAKIVSHPGETVQIEAPIAILTEKDEKLPPDFSIDSYRKVPEPGGVERGVMKAESIQKSTHGAEQGGRVKISPVAKKLAKDMNIDYTQITLSKPGARIEKADVLAFTQAMESMREEVPKKPKVTQGPKVAQGPIGQVEQSIIPLRGIRKVIAQRLSESAHTTARAVLFLKTDAGKLISKRESLSQSGKKVSFDALFVSVLAKALKEFPQMNSRLDGEYIRLADEINIGVAVDTEKGLIVPVIHKADTKDILTIHRELSEKIERAKTGRIPHDDISEGTFTLTNLGMFGIESFIPIINPPECAILALGAITREPVVIDESDTVAVRPMLQMSLVFDHRIVDGAPAARFLNGIKELVENADNL